MLSSRRSEEGLNHTSGLEVRLKTVLSFLGPWWGGGRDQKQEQSLRMSLTAALLPGGLHAAPAGVLTVPVHLQTPTHPGKAPQPDSRKMVSPKLVLPSHTHLLGSSSASSSMHAVCEAFTLLSVKAKCTGAIFLLPPQSLPMCVHATLRHAISHHHLWEAGRALCIGRRAGGRAHCTPGSHTCRRASVKSSAACASQLTPGSSPFSSAGDLGEQTL